MSRFDKISGTYLLHLTDDEALTVMDALANHVESLYGWPSSDYHNNEGAADPMDTYQEVSRQLHKQDWGTKV